MPTLGGHTLLRVIWPAKAFDEEPTSRPIMQINPSMLLVHEPIKSDESPSAEKLPHLLNMALAKP